MVRVDGDSAQFGAEHLQAHGAERGLHDQRGGGVDVDAGAERTVGDAAVDDVLDEPVHGRDHAGVLARQCLGKVVVVVGEAAVDLVLRCAFSRCAYAVDQHPQRGDGGKPFRLFAPYARRLGHDLVDQREQQLVLRREVLVEGPQRGLRTLDDLEHGEVGATGFAKDRERGAHEATFAGFGFCADRFGGSPARLRHGNDVTGFVCPRLLFPPMTTDSAQQWTVRALLDLFDVQADGENRFIAETGPAGEDERQVVEGTQVLAQMIVAASKRFPEKSVRSVYAVFARAVMVGAGPVELEIDVVGEGRSTATAIVSAKQNGKRCITATLLADVPTADVIRHHLQRPYVAAPADANVSEMPMDGRQLRLVDVVDVNSPDEVGPPELYAWLHYDPIPDARRPCQGSGRVFHRPPWDFDDDAGPRGNRHQPGAPHGLDRADDCVGELP